MNAKLDPQNEMHRLAHNADGWQDERQAEDEREGKPYNGEGFPGCGDGSDDLADYNQNESMDYLNE